MTNPTSASHRTVERPWRVEEKENDTPKSRGISPKNFHRKRDKEDSFNKVKMDKLKEEVETSLLSQEKQHHAKDLEAKRKAFRKVTTLKTWPLQDLAMDHLDHLLSKNSSHQFHGGDYLSADSSSSLESMENKRRVSPTKSKQEKDEEKTYNFEASNEPLWSREPRIFATEKSKGKRKYMVGHFGRVADWYWRKANPKHLYEVIREKTPCRLYFDLEFSKAHNPDIDEEELLLEFRDELAADLMTHFEVALESKQIIDLESSTDVKFSRHWIVDTTDCLFEDAPTVGRFVKRLVSRLADELGTGQLAERKPELAKYLFVQTKDEGKTSCFIDLGVYTRNRLFRCFASSKFGKKATLEIGRTNEYPLEVPPKQPPKKHVSLEDYIAANDWEPHARALAKTLVVPLEAPEDIRILKVEEGEFSGLKGTGSGETRSRNNTNVRITTSSSPVPSLDDYINKELSNRGGVQGAIRVWSMENGPRDVPVSITYQLSRNRYCELIGRSHKSNNIFWTVDLASWTCIQGCHDPDCFGRGTPIPIPADKVKSMEGELASHEEKRFEEELMKLDLGQNETPSGIETTSTVAESNEQNTTTNSESSNPKLGGVDRESADDLLSDDAILDAVLSNPELFP